MLPRLLPCLLLLLAACGSTNNEEGGEDEAPRLPAPLAAELPSDGELWRTARDVGFDEMIDDLREADVVYVGEFHQDEDSHLIQLRIIEHLAHYGRLHAIGMEMFQRPYQAVLDDYVFGKITEAEMLERTEWKKRWRIDFGLYRPILEFARSKRIPVLALNVSTEIRNKVRKEGMSGLSPEESMSLPAIDVRTSDDHRAYIRKSYDDHKEFIEDYSDEDFEKFYLVQCMWDAVMSDTVVQWFKTAPDDAQVVVLVGSGHLGNRYGIPDRLESRIGKEHRIVIPMLRQAVEREQFAEEYADYVWVTGKKPDDAAAAE